MKKLVAVLLSILMIMSIVPCASFAAVKDDDAIINDILEGDYYHLTYTEENNYFKAKIAAYTALGFYEDSWDNYFTGSVDMGYAKTILLALIDRFEAEYNNETYEEILGALKAAKTVAQLIEKVDGYTEILDIAESSEWATSLGVLNGVIKAANLANDTYEKFVEGYAVILSCQAANVYYGDFLSYIEENCTDKNVVKAAKELKANITASLEEARDNLILQLTEDAAKDGAAIGVDIAMNAYSVTAIINTVYKTLGNIGDKVFATADKYQYMSSLAMISKIEDIVPAYVKKVMAGEDELASSFALSSLITLRETGEEMIVNYGKVKEDSISGKIFTDSEAATLKNSGSIACAKLGVYRDIIASDVEYTTYEVTASVDDSKTARVYDADNNLLAVLSAGKASYVIDETGAYASVYNDALGKYVKVVVPFAEGYTVQYAAASSTGGSSSAPKTGFAAIIQAIMDAIANFFASLFSFGKK